MDMKNTKRRIILVLLLVAVAIICVAVLLRERARILWNYIELTDAAHAREVLQRSPLIRRWAHVSNPNAIDIGFARFAWPLSEIQRITVKDGNAVHVVTDMGGLFIKPPFKYGRISEEITAILEDSGAHVILEGGRVKWTNDDYSDTHWRICELQATNPYEFQRRVFLTQPQSLLKVMFMDIEDLALYEHLLELKYARGNDPQAFFFETEVVTGFVGRPQGSRTSVIIEIYDAKRKFMCMGILEVSEGMPTPDLEGFISTFAFTIDDIPDTSAKLKTVITDALRTQPAYQGK